MRVVALISGGKDSCHALLHCCAAGHQVVALANLNPQPEQDELDSHMYQTVGHEVIELMATALRLKLYRRTITGAAVRLNKDYEPTEQDEVEDLFQLLNHIQTEIAFDAVCSGAILSDYQRMRVENVCARLGLQSFSFLWRRDQENLVEEMIATGLDAVLIKVAALGLKPRAHLGKSLAQLLPHLKSLHQRYDVHVAGEGGEYETLTLDSPLFFQRIAIEEQEIVMVSDDAICPVGHLRIRKAALVDKADLPPSVDDMPARIALARRLLFGSGTAEPRLPAYILPYSFLLRARQGPPASLQPKALRPVDLLQTDVHQPSVRSTGGQKGPLRIYVVETSASEEQQPPAAAAAALLQRLVDALAKDNYTTEHVRHVNVFVADMAAFASINERYAQVFDKLPPSRVCVELPLGNPSALRLEVFACRSDDVGQDPNHMYVRSWSYWAPANIGPYSQAVKVGSCLFMAGQIGLDPPTMELLDSVEEQAAAALISYQHVLDAHGLTLSYVAGATCYGTSLPALETAMSVMRKHTEREAFVLGAVVAALPKAASVEWHFFAASPATADENLQSAPIEYDTTDYHAPGVVQWCGHSWATAGIVIRRQTKEVQGQATAVADAVLGALAAASALAPVNLRGDALVRLLYTVTSCEKPTPSSGLDLQAVQADILARMPVAVVSFVPVLSLTSSVGPADLAAQAIVFQRPKPVSALD